VAASQDALETARSLARSKAGTVEFGFLGAPPGLDSPNSLAAFTQAHPAIQIRYRDLPFPTRPTSSWIADVDIAVCHAPPADPTVWTRPLRREPRMVLAPARHPVVAGRRELAVVDVVDEEFISLHPAVDREWAGFWSLDDHRGAPPQRATLDHAANPQEVLAALAAREAITTAPAPVARVIAGVLPTIVAVALTDAAESVIMLVGHKGIRNPLVETVLTFVSAHIGAA
jgi:DNA-binding transcriptional LysR family regulator